MFFKDFYRQVGTLPPDVMQAAEELCQEIELEALIDEEVNSRYPSFHGYLGTTFQWLVKDGSRRFRHDQTKINKVHKYIESLRLPNLRNKMVYVSSAPMAKPGGYGDWHYDTNIRSMICVRFHIPIFTEPETLFYGKWFNDTKAYQYHLAKGGIYELNNRVPHAVYNGGKKIRYHLVVDYIDIEAIDFMRRTGRLEHFILRHLASARHDRNEVNYIGTPTTPVIELPEVPIINKPLPWIMDLANHYVSYDSWKSKDKHYLQFLEYILDNLAQFE